MKDKSCQNCLAQMHDYLNDELPVTDKMAISEHLQQCKSCQNIFEHEQSLLASLHGLASPDPGKIFWDAFPQQVLQAYKQEVRHEMQSKQTTGFINKLRDLFTIRPSLLQGLTYSIMIGVVVLLLYTYNGAPAQPDITAYLVALEHPQQIAQHLDKNKMISHNANIFSFSKQNDINYFTLGTLYSHASTYLIVGDHQKAAIYLNKIQSLPFNSAAIKTKLNNTISALNNPATANEEVVVTMQQLYHILASTLPDKNNTLHTDMFNLGIWINYTMIAAATDNTGILQQKSLHDFFKITAQSSQLAPGVLSKLKKINTLFATSPLDDNTATQITALCRQIQSILL